jgi:hypothetical protein
MYSVKEDAIDNGEHSFDWSPKLRPSQEARANNAAKTFSRFKSRLPITLSNFAYVSGAK